MTPSKSHGQLYDVTVCSNYIPHTFTSCGEVTMSYLLWWTVDVPILTIWQCSSSMMILSATWLLACYMYICWWYRYLLEDWSGSITASLHPVATKSATSRQGSMVGEGGQWEGRSVLIKVGSARVMDAGRGGKGVWGREWSKKRRYMWVMRKGRTSEGRVQYTQVHVCCNKATNLKICMYSSWPSLRRFCNC